MQNLIFVNVLQADGDLNEKSPYFIFFHRSFILKLQKVIQITIIAILHNDIESIIFDK